MYLLVIDEKKQPNCVSVTVVVLETLNSALQKQASSSNGKVSSIMEESELTWSDFYCMPLLYVSCAPSQLPSPAVEPESDSDNQVEDSSGSGQESNQGSKRKRPVVETETDQDSDADSKHWFSFFLLCLPPSSSSFLSLHFACSLQSKSHV